MNNNNLIPNSKRSKEELQEMGRKGGIASGKERRKKKEIKKMCRWFAEIVKSEKLLEGLIDSRQTKRKR